MSRGSSYREEMRYEAKKLFELKRFSSYGGSSNREFFMKVY